MKNCFTFSVKFVDTAKCGVRALLFALLLFANGSLYAAKDGGKLSGRVVDNNGKPLIGATVVIAGSHLGAITDVYGSFVISVEDLNFPLTLQASFLGYRNQSVNINNRSEIANIVFKMSATSLQVDDVVVVGYGTTSNRMLTGAVSTVNSETINKLTNDSPILSLQGSATGVYVQQGSGVPGGGDTEVIIRGKTSFNSSQTPLYIVDGIPFNASEYNPNGYAVGIFESLDPLNMINPEDIASIEILKDAEATAIYGARGSEGVILITTKRGQSGKAKINFSHSSKLSTASSNIDYLNTEDYLALRYKAVDADLAAGLITESSLTPTRYPDLYEWSQTEDYNWQDLAIGSTAYEQAYDISISGGNNTTIYSVSAGYYNSDAIAVGNDEFSRYTSRLSVSHHSADNRLSVDASFGMTRLDQNASWGQNTVFSAADTPPNTPIYNEDGSIYWMPGNTSFSSPLAFTNVSTKNITTSMMSNVNIGYKIIKVRVSIMPTCQKATTTPKMVVRGRKGDIMCSTQRRILLILS